MNGLKSITKIAPKVGDYAVVFTATINYLLQHVYDPHTYKKNLST